MGLLLWSNAREAALIAAENRGLEIIGALVFLMFVLFLAALAYTGREDSPKNTASGK